MFAARTLFVFNWLLLSFLRNIGEEQECALPVGWDDHKHRACIIAVDSRYKRSYERVPTSWNSKINASDELQTKVNRRV